MEVRPFVVSLDALFFFGSAAFQFGLTSACGRVVGEVLPDALVGGNPDGAPLVDGDRIYGIAGELHLFPLAQRKVAETALVCRPDVSGTIDREVGRVYVEDAVFFVEQAPAVLVVDTLLGDEACDAGAVGGHEEFMAVFGPYEGGNLLARQHLALLFELPVAVDEQTVVCTDPQGCPLVCKGGNAVRAEFAFVAFPTLAVKAEESLRGTDPELFGAVFVKDGRNGVVHHEVPGHLDFDDVRFVVGVLDVVELLDLAGVFVKAAFGAHVYAHGITDLRVALQRDGVVVDPLFTVKFQDAFRGTGPEFALGEEPVLGTARHAGKERGVLRFLRVRYAPFVGERPEGEARRVVVHGRSVVCQGGTGFTHTQLACAYGHFEGDNRGTGCERKSRSKK